MLFWYHIGKRCTWTIPFISSVFVYICNWRNLFVCKPEFTYCCLQIWFFMGGLLFEIPSYLLIQGLFFIRLSKLMIRVSTTKHKLSFLSSRWIIKLSCTNVDEHSGFFLYMEYWVSLHWVLNSMFSTSLTAMFSSIFLLFRFMPGLTTLHIELVKLRWPKDERSFMNSFLCRNYSSKFVLILCLDHSKQLLEKPKF